MKVTLTNEEIMKCYQTVYRKGGLFDNERKEDLQIPISLIWKIKKNMKELKKIVEQYQESWQEYFNKYPQEVVMHSVIHEDGSIEQEESHDENGNTIYRINNDSIQDFVKCIEQLDAITNTLELDTFTESDLEKMNSSIDPKYFNGLDFMV